MNDNDTLNGPDTGGVHSGETLTGEQDARAPAAPQQAKNKSNITFFLILAVVVLVVLAMGYMAFGRHRHAAVPAPVQNTAPTQTLSPAAPATAVTTAPTASLQPAPAKAPTLTSQADANALLGGAPTATATAAIAAPAASTTAALPSAPAGALPNALTVPPANPLTQAPATLPAPASTTLPTNPLAQAPVAPPAATLPTNPAEINALTAAAQSPTNPANALSAPAHPAAAPVAQQTLPSVLAPTAAATVAAVPSSAPVTTSATPAVSVESRVAELETRMSNLEAGQARIVDILAHMSPAQKGDTAVPPHPTHVGKRVRRVHHADANVVKVLPAADSAKPATTSPTKADAASASCHLASIVPNRAWTKQQDGTFMTYGVGDRAPNGGIIKAIDPDRGIVTDKGKQVCPMVD